MPAFRWGAAYDFAKCSQKLHEIERIWTLVAGGGCWGVRPLDPPMVLNVKQFNPVKLVSELENKFILSCIF